MRQSIGSSFRADVLCCWTSRIETSRASSRVDGVTLPRSVRELDCYADRHSVKGVFTKEEISAAASVGFSAIVDEPRADTTQAYVVAPSPRSGTPPSTPPRRVRGKQRPSLDAVLASVEKRIGAIDRKSVNAEAVPALLQALADAERLDSEGKGEQGRNIVQGTLKLHSTCSAAKKAFLATIGHSDARSPVKDANLDGDPLSAAELAGDWYVLVGSPSHPAGSTIDVTSRTTSGRGSFAIVDGATQSLVAFRAKPEDAASRLRALRIASSGRVVADFAGKEDIYAVGAAAAASASAEPGTPKAEADALRDELDLDVRILKVHTERDGRRHRRLEDAQPEYVEDDFSDWPIEGGRTLSNTTRELRRANLTFLAHHDSWVKNSGVAGSSRAVHEHRNICKALHDLATYDQLNLVNICGAERLDLRRQLIETAHQGRPDMPVYDMQDEFMGDRPRNGVLVDQTRVAYAAQKQGLRAKILKQSRKAREETAAYLRRNVKVEDPEAVDASGAGGGAPSKPTGRKAKGPGKGADPS